MVCEKDVPCSERLKQRLFGNSGAANVETETPMVKAWVREAVKIGDAPHVGIDAAEAERVRNARTAADAGKQGKVFEPVATGGGDAPRTKPNDKAVKRWEDNAPNYGLSEPSAA